MAIRASFDAVLRWSPAQLAFRRRAGQSLAVLAYHGVDDPANFGRQLDHLTRTMRPVSLDQVLDALAGRRPLPPRAVLVTFDDGDRSVLDAAMPVLAARNLEAVVFVVAGLLDSDRPFWWVETRRLLERGGRAAWTEGVDPLAVVARMKRMADGERLATLDELRRTAEGPAPPAPQLRRDELRLLVAGGVAVGNHTMTHPCLPRCDGAKAMEELLGAHRILCEALGHEPLAFAYPNGDWDARVELALARAGYQAAFLFDHRANLSPPRHPLRLSRLRVNAASSLDRFALITSGLHPALHHARGRR